MRITLLNKVTSHDMETYPLKFLLEVRMVSFIFEFLSLVEYVRFPVGRYSESKQLEG